MTQLKPFLVRLRPDVRTMLERAAEHHKKSIAAVINDELSRSLKGHSDLDTRLSKFLG
jgi:uncharacterized protein (DUF1778 family)